MAKIPTAKQLEVMALYSIQGLTVNEIAYMLGISQPAVSQRLQRLYNNTPSLRPKRTKLKRQVRYTPDLDHKIMKKL